MEDKKYSYSINWTQPYTLWIPSKEWLDAADAAVIEGRLEQQGLSQAQEIINNIRYK
jgi:hypothetical protein